MEKRARIIAVIQSFMGVILFLTVDLKADELINKLPDEELFNSEPEEQTTLKAEAEAAKKRDPSTDKGNENNQTPTPAKQPVARPLAVPKKTEGVYNGPAPVGTTDVAGDTTTTHEKASGAEDQKAEQQQPSAAASSPTSEEKKPDQANKTDQADESKSDDTVSSDYTYGQKRIGFGIAQPSYDKDVPYYKSMYNSSSMEYFFRSDYFFIKKYLALGLGFNFGVYRDSGVAAVSSNAGSGGRLAEKDLDRGSQLELTLVPLRVPVSLVIAPIPPLDWFQISAEAGYERMYSQEVRQSKSYSSSDGSATRYVSTGWNQAQYYGAAVHFKLDALDTRAVSSLQILGIESVYLTLFYNKFKTMDYKLLPLDRSMTGVEFTFESIH
jgi:hypothetical protein